MTKYEIKKVIGQSKTGKTFKCLQVVAHTDVGDYTSGYIFPSSFRPEKSPDWFGDDDNIRSSKGLSDIYSDSEFQL